MFSHEAAVQPKLAEAKRGPGGNPFRSLHSKPAGTLRLLPRFNARGLVQLTVLPNFSSDLASEESLNGGRGNP